MAKQTEWYRRYVAEGIIYQRKIDGIFSGMWNYSLYINNTRVQKSLRTTSKLLAGEKAAEIYTKYRSIPHLKKSPVENMIEEFSVHDADIVKPNHTRKRKMQVRRFFDIAEISDVMSITPEVINKYIDMRAAAGISPKTRSNEFGAICAFCRWAKSRGYLHTNPARDAEPPKVPRGKIIYLQKSELDTALAIARKKEIWGVFFAYYAALRVHEIWSLTWNQINLGEQPTITVTGKGDGDGKTVTLPLHPELVKIIVEKFPRIDGQEKLFPRRSHEWWNEALKPIKAACPTVAMRGQGWHTFRRTFGSILIQAGVGVERVSKLLRHADVATTMRHYAHLIPEHGRADLLKL